VLVKKWRVTCAALRYRDGAIHSVHHGNSH
jgi:hypothetical protein